MGGVEGGGEGWDEEGLARCVPSGWVTGCAASLGVSDGGGDDRATRRGRREEGREGVGSVVCLFDEDDGVVAKAIGPVQYTRYQIPDTPVAPKDKRNLPTH